MKPTTMILLAGLGLASIGCAAWPKPGDQVPLTGEDPVSIATLEEYLEDHPFGRHRDSVSFRLAMLHLTPEDGAYDPGEARTLLWPLAGGSPGPFRDGARQVLALLTEGRAPARRDRLARPTARAVGRRHHPSARRRRARRAPRPRAGSQPDAARGRGRKAARQAVASPARECLSERAYGSTVARAFRAQADRHRPEPVAPHKSRIRPAIH